MPFPFCTVSTKVLSLTPLALAIPVWLAGCGESETRAVADPIVDHMPQLEGDTANTGTTLEEPQAPVAGTQSVVGDRSASPAATGSAQGPTDAASEADEFPEQPQGDQEDEERSAETSDGEQGDGTSPDMELGEEDSSTSDMGAAQPTDACPGVEPADQRHGRTATAHRRACWGGQARRPHAVLDYQRAAWGPRADRRSYPRGCEGSCHLGQQSSVLSRGSLSRHSILRGHVSAGRPQVLTPLASAQRSGSKTSTTTPCVGRRLRQASPCNAAAVHDHLPGSVYARTTTENPTP